MHNLSKSQAQVPHRLGLPLPDLRHGQAEVLGRHALGHRHRRRRPESVAQPYHCGEVWRQVEKQIRHRRWVPVAARDGMPFWIMRRGVSSAIRLHRRADPVPRVRRESHSPVGIEPIDGADQSDCTGLHRVAHLITTEAVEHRSQRHGAHTHGDESVASAGITASCPTCQGPLVSGRNRCEGEQVTDELIHVDSVLRPDVRRRPGTRPCGRTAGPTSAGDVDAHRPVAQLTVLLLEGDQLTEHPVVDLGLVDRIGALQLGLDLVDAARRGE